jgi:hypothetical protein
MENLVAIDRISSQRLMDLPEVPQRQRTAGFYRRLAAGHLIA